MKTNEIYNILSRIASLTIQPIKEQVSTRMTYTIGEHIEETYGYYVRISHETCPVCKDEYLTFLNDDPGSVEAAVGITYPCDHPTCREVSSGAIFCGSDIDNLLRLSSEELQDLVEEKGTDLIECDYKEISIMEILLRRDEEKEPQVYDDNYEAWLMEMEGGHEHREVDLETEKWDNYWSDYNQCGIHISR